jgi:Sel1 repeat
MKTSWIHRLFQGLSLAALLISTIPAAQADTFDDDLQSVWEVLWDQRGSPRYLFFWEKSSRPITYKVHGHEAAKHVATVAELFAEMSLHTGLKFSDRTNEADTPEQVNISVEIEKSQYSMEAQFICYVQPKDFSGGYLKRIRLMMKDRSIWSCGLHEMMHAMGLSGHPSGRTVLGYLSNRHRSLSELDKTMLKALYSGKMPQAATPFQAYPVMMQHVLELHGQDESKLPELRERANRFQQELIQKMEAFASGSGEVPPIVRRSGLASEEFIAQARNTMAFYLGVAYMDGHIVARNRTMGLDWLKKSADAGNELALTTGGLIYFHGRGVPADRTRGYSWLRKSAKQGSKFAAQELEKIHQSLSAEELEKIKSD